MNGWITLTRQSNNSELHIQISHIAAFFNHASAGAIVQLAQESHYFHVNETAAEVASRISAAKL
jgi:hypothetical protein